MMCPHQRGVITSHDGQRMAQSFSHLWFRGLLGTLLGSLGALSKPYPRPQGEPAGPKSGQNETDQGPKERPKSMARPCHVFGPFSTPSRSPRGEQARPPLTPAPRVQAAPRVSEALHASSSRLRRGSSRAAQGGGGHEHEGARRAVSVQRSRAWTRSSPIVELPPEWCHHHRC